MDGMGTSEPVPLPFDRPYDLGESIFQSVSLTKTIFQFKCIMILVVFIRILQVVAFFLHECCVGHKDRGERI